MTNDPDRPTEQTRPVGGDTAERLRQFTLLAPGSTFAGRYRIEARIGGGGAGEVYRALDELSGAHVAIKVLFPHGEDRHPLERLRRELRLVRGLSHPGIVRTHDIGEHGGLLYLVMDLLEGETLRARLQRGRLALDELLAILAQVLEALAAAHAAGIVHRDVKPGNILLERRIDPPAAEPDAIGRAVLLDFGLARSGSEPGLTRTGAFLGTPEYVSPEQARAERSVGPPADVYSAGIVLWEMLAGRPPFEGDSQVEILLAHAQRPLPPPHRALASAPGWLRDLAAWMLEKDPARRPADAGEALSFLRRRRRAPLGRRWRTAGRARGRAVRRIALVASLLVLGGALAAATLLPAAVEVEGRAIRATNRFGLPTRSARAPFSIIPSAPRIDSRRFLAGLMREPGMPREAPSLAVFDGLSGTLTPLPFSRDVLGATCDTVFPRLSCDYGLSKLVAVPDEPGLGIPRYAAVYTHLLEHSNLLVVFDGSGTALVWLPFAGAIQEPVFLPARSDPPQPPLLVASVEFHDLGQRLGIVALPLTFNGAPFVGALEAPPYDLPVHDTIARRPVYVTFAPLGRYAEASVGPDGRLELARSDGPPLAFDARSGVPLDGPDAPRDPAAWLAAQSRLLDVLEQAARHGAAGLPGEGASLLERFADAEARAPSQRGAALGLAAALRRRAGELDRALEDARKARAEEPELLGHQRLLIDLLARSGSWGDVQQALLSFDLGARSAQDLPADAVAAALLLRRAAEARQIMEKAMGAPLRPEERQASNALFQVLLALEEGEPERVAALLAPVPWASEYSQVALVGAIAAALRDPLDPAAVTRWAGAARTGCGVSVAAPLVAVEALLAARTGQPGPTEAQLADALARQDAAGREHLVELLLARWAHRLADEAAKVRAQPR